MSCAQCGGKLVICVESTEVKDNGDFREDYRCGSCGAEGAIYGREEDSPEDWKKVGRCFR